MQVDISSANSTKSADEISSVISGSAGEIDPDLSDFEFSENEDVVKNTMAILADLKRQLDHVREVNEVLVDDLESTRRQAGKTSAVSALRSKEIDRQAQMISRLKSEKAQVIAELDASEDERKESVVEIFRLKQELEQGYEKNQLLQKNIAEVEANISKTIQDSIAKQKKLSARLGIYESKIVDLESRLDQRVRDLFDANATIDDLKISIDNLQKQVVNLEQNRSNSNLLLSKLQDSIKDVRDQAMKYKHAT
ncbi:MAG: hypothetical protein GY854_24155 [Deltaproteobacteria bacterium]|nr:hypothetical protein [Deltaproteobacteria bacterium]